MSERREVTAPDGHRISYLVEGAGPVVVIVPAVLQSASLWEEVGYLSRLAVHHRVIAVDPLGHGESDRPAVPEAYAPDALVSHVVSVLLNEDAGPAVVWGYAAGAETALLVARRRPDLVSGVVIGASFLGEVRGGLEVLGLERDAHTERLAEALDRGDWDAYFDERVGTFSHERRADLKADNDPSVIAAIVRAGLLRPRGFLMPAKPTFAYWGEDEVFAAGNSRIASGFPLQWAVLPGERFDDFYAIDDVLDAVGGFLRDNFRD